MLRHISKAPTGALTPCRNAGCGFLLAPAMKAQRRGVAPARASAAALAAQEEAPKLPKPLPWLTGTAGSVVAACSVLHLQREWVSVQEAPRMHDAQRLKVTDNGIPIMALLCCRWCRWCVRPA